MRIIDGQRIETECESCCCTFTTDRDETGWPDQELCSECRETLHDLKQAMMAEMEHAKAIMALHCERTWWETFLSFPFKQLPAPHHILTDLDSVDAELEEWRDWRNWQDSMDVADQAAFYSPRWPDE